MASGDTSGLGPAAATAEEEALGLDDVAVAAADLAKDLNRVRGGGGSDRALDEAQGKMRDSAAAAAATEEMREAAARHRDMVSRLRSAPAPRRLLAAKAEVERDGNGSVRAHAARGGSSCSGSSGGCSVTDTWDLVASRPQHRPAAGRGPPRPVHRPARNGTDLTASSSLPWRAAQNPNPPIAGLSPPHSANK
jgi:hypothetical protein